jgi:hypothetical protein
VALKKRLNRAKNSQWLPLQLYPGGLVPLDELNTDYSVEKKSLKEEFEVAETL